MKMVKKLIFLVCLSSILIPQFAVAGSVVVYTDNRTYHIGDEEFNSRKWRAVHGECYNANFNANFSTRALIVNLQTYGAESQNTILLNGEYVATLPPQGLNKPNRWTSSRRVHIPLSEQMPRGNNRLSICAVPVKVAPEFQGDLDDFQIRKLKILIQ